MTARSEIPLDHCFLIGDQQMLWHPERGELHYLFVLDGDPDFHEACRNYLRRIGSAFASVEEVMEEVRRRGLPKVNCN